jgi:Nuclease-related domain
VDSDVQDPPNRPADESGGLAELRALFEKQDADTQVVPAVGPADASADEADARRGDDDTLEFPAIPGKGATAPRRPAPQGRPQQLPRSAPLAGRQFVNPRLGDDPRLRIWVIRTIVAIVVYFGFLFWHGWRLGLTAAAIYIAADILFQSRRLSVVPASARVTIAQRNTRRRLKMLEPLGYISLNARTIPGTPHVIDHLVIGPGGVFAVDSERLDDRLQIRARGGKLFYGKDNMEPRLEHASMEADHAARLIAAQIGRRVRVQPAMVIYGPALPWVVLRFADVDVFDGGRIGTYFRRQSKETRHRHLASSDIAKIFSAAAHALPPMR